MDLKYVIISSILSLIVGILIKMVVKNRIKTYKSGINAGIFISILIRKVLHICIIKIPVIKKHAKTIENLLEWTGIDFMDGCKVGLRLDNKQQRKDIKELLKKADLEDIDKIKKYNEKYQKQKTKKKD